MLEQDDEWAVAERRYFSAESMKQLTEPALPPTTREIVPRSRERESGSALVENRSSVSKQRWTVRLPATPAAASTGVELRERVREEHHMTGHYR